MIKKNAGLKVLAAVVLGVTTLLLINGKHSQDNDNSVKQDPNNFNEAIASQFNDNIRDVAARLQETEKKLDDLQQQNKNLNEENTRLSHSPIGIQMIPDRISNNKLEQEIAELKESIALLKSSQQKNLFIQDYPVGDPDIATVNPGVKDIDAVLMKRQLSDQENNYWEKFSPHRKDLLEAPQEGKIEEKEKAVPWYTIPAGSDLANTTLLSALIGEVPNDGKLAQPLFPFSAVISRGDLMAANGIALPPNISGMKVGGYALGVGSFLDDISCVRAYVTSALFVFEDGHFVTVGKDHMKNSAEMIDNESLGYLTTAYGNPCIRGQYFTNAPRVLAAMMAAGGVQGLGTALPEWQTSRLPEGNQATGTPTSFKNYALGGALSQGSIKAADWLEKRIQGSFDMVFVPASFPAQGQYQPTRLSLHITQTIELDKQLQGRVLDYGNAQRHTHDFSLR